MFFLFSNKVAKKKQCFRVFFHVCKTPQVFSVFLLRKWHRQVVEILLRHCGSWAVRSPRRTPTSAAPTSCRADSTRRRKRSVFGGNYKIQTRKKLKKHIHKQPKMTWKVLRGWFLFVVSRFYCCCRHMHMFSVSFRELFEGISNFRSSKKTKRIRLLFVPSGSSSGDWWNLGQRRVEPHISKLEVAVPSSSAAAFGSSIATECLGWMCDDCVEKGVVDEGWQRMVWWCFVVISWWLKVLSCLIIWSQANT